MKSAIALMALSAVLLISQATFATATSGSGDWYQAASCSGKAYCFSPETEAPRSNPTCPDGYKLDKVAKNCYKNMPDTCPAGTSKCEDPTVCLSCDASFKLTQKGKCVKPCKDGYSAVSYGGKKYCVQDCDQGYYSYGSKCISYTKFISNNNCDKSKCLPQYTFCPSVKTAYSADLDTECYADPKFGPVFKTYDLGVKASVESKFSALLKLDLLLKPKCKCVRSYTRDAYEQESVDAKKTPINTNVMTAPATCTGGSAPDSTFMCRLPCPSSCTTTSTGGCVYACPNGFKACTYNGVSFCATKSKLINNDSCAVLSAAWQFVDRSVMCPVPSSAKVKVNVGVGLGLHL